MNKQFHIIIIEEEYTYTATTQGDTFWLSIFCTLHPLRHITLQTYNYFWEQWEGISVKVDIFLLCYSNVGHILTVLLGKQFSLGYILEGRPTQNKNTSLGVWKNIGWCLRSCYLKCFWDFVNNSVSFWTVNDSFKF